MSITRWRDNKGLPLWQRIRWTYLRRLPLRSEVVTAYVDLRSILAGYCNHKPWRADCKGGGYANWRCGYKRGHGGLHRSNNYVWTDDGQTDYMPVGLHRGPRIVNRRAYAHIHGQTYRQRFARDRWHREEEARRAAARANP